MPSLEAPPPLPPTTKTSKTGTPPPTSPPPSPVDQGADLDSDCRRPIAAASSPGATSTGALAKSTAMNSYEKPDDGITHTTATFQQWADAAGSPPTPPSSP